MTEQPSSLWLTCIAVDANGRLYVGSDGDGIFRSSTPLTGTSHESSRQAVQFRLDQNYPNPFSPTATIEFQIPHTSFVTLNVFDVLGREVAMLVNEEMNTGGYAREFTGTGLASGIYLYRLRAGDFVQTRRLLLLR